MDLPGSDSLNRQILPIHIDCHPQQERQGDHEHDHCRDDYQGDEVGLIYVHVSQVVQDDQGLDQQHDQDHGRGCPGLQHALSLMERCVSVHDAADGDSILSFPEISFIVTVDGNIPIFRKSYAG